MDGEELLPISHRKLAVGTKKAGGAVGRPRSLLMLPGGDDADYTLGDSSPAAGRHGMAGGARRLGPAAGGLRGLDQDGSTKGWWSSFSYSYWVGQLRRWRGWGTWLAWGLDVGWWVKSGRVLLRAGLAAQRAAAAAAADDDGAPGKRKRRPRELEDEDAMVGAVPKVRPWDILPYGGRMMWVYTSSEKAAWR